MKLEGSSVLKVKPLYLPHSPTRLRGNGLISASDAGVTVPPDIIQQFTEKEREHWVTTRMLPRETCKREPRQMCGECARASTFRLTVSNAICEGLDVNCRHVTS